LLFLHLVRWQQGRSQEVLNPLSQQFKFFMGLWPSWLRPWMVMMMMMIKTTIFEWLIVELYAASASYIYHIYEKTFNLIKLIEIAKKSTIFFSVQSLLLQHCSWLVQHLCLIFISYFPQCVFFYSTKKYSNIVAAASRVDLQS
jgi:hypothetical protein